MCMINVLWINNNSHSYSALENEADIRVKLCDSVSECVEYLRHEKGVWDAVLISDICKSKPDGFAKVDNMSDANNEIRDFGIPFFFITDRTDFTLYDVMVFNFILKGERPFHIANDKQKLLPHLRVRSKNFQ